MITLPIWQAVAALLTFGAISFFGGITVMALAEAARRADAMIAREDA